MNGWSATSAKKKRFYGSRCDEISERIDNINMICFRKNNLKAEIGTNVIFRKCLWYCTQFTNINLK